MPKQDAIAAEGRAIAARPSLCLLAALLALGASLIFSSAASAANGKLILNGTTPPSSASSPAESTTPLLRGGESGVIISVVGPRALLPARTSVWGASSNEVRIYTDPNCLGAPVAEGTFGELKSPGIEVEVEEDSTTTFYATQTEAEDPFAVSECSSGLTYYQGEAVDPGEEEPSAGGGGGGGEPPAGGGSGGAGNGAPGVTPAAPVAPRLYLQPKGRSNLNNPQIAGSAAGAERVRIFASGRCGGTPIAEAGGAELAAGVVVRVPDNSETAFSALSLAGGAKSECSQTVTYVEDSTAPRTRITMAPGAKTRRRKAVFRFADVSGDPTGTQFECKLDRRSWQACYSPFKVKRLGYRRHTLKIRGADAAGNFESKAVKRSFKVVRVP